ncbi:hypothetical protein HMI55_000441 [Coelomomyces lativittatus]|nr:hypothetical protein HMI55_000441 [Coelomomyces lativittatus]
MNGRYFGGQCVEAHLLDPHARYGKDRGGSPDPSSTLLPETSTSDPTAKATTSAPPVSSHLQNYEAWLESHDQEEAMEED